MKRAFMSAPLLTAVAVGTVLAHPAYIQRKKSSVADEILIARTVYVESRTGVMATVEEELEKWGRLQVTGNSAEADLILEFTLDRTPEWGDPRSSLANILGSILTGTEHVHHDLHFTVKSPRTGVRLYKASRYCISSHRDAVKAILRQFRKKVEK